MATIRRWRATWCLRVLVAVGAMTSMAQAHVQVLTPNGGELLDHGMQYQISWTITIAHNLQNWDVFYSTTGPNGPFNEVAVNLPPGDPSVGSIHTYDWTIPPKVPASSDCYIKVIMDNSGTDYDDTSDQACTISRLILDAGGSTFNSGDNLSFEFRASLLPNEFAGLFVTDVNGAPSFTPVLFGNLDGLGFLSAGGVVPPGLSGLVLEFTALATSPKGAPEVSNSQVLTFL